MGFLSHKGQKRLPWWGLGRLQCGGSIHRDHPQAGAPTKVHPQQGPQVDGEPALSTGLCLARTVGKLSKHQHLKENSRTHAAQHRARSLAPITAQRRTRQMLQRRLERVRVWKCVTYTDDREEDGQSWPLGRLHGLLVSFTTTLAL